MASIVILGAGLGGMSAAYEIRALLGRQHSIAVVGDGPTFNFTPSNPWVAVGWRKPSDIRLDVTRPVEDQGMRFVPVAARKVVPEAKRIDLVDGRSLAYDYLVIATGLRLAFERVPGSGPEGFTQSVCTGPHAERAWDAYQKFLDHPGAVVVGAMPGASCFGPAYEFAMILDTDLRRRKLRDRVPMTFVTPEPYIGHMGLGGIGDSEGLLESEMRQRHIKWITNSRVTGVEEGKLHLEELDRDGKVAHTHELPFAYSMLIPAFAGVCVAIPPVEATPVPVGVPKTGLMIESMVSAIAENLRDELAGKPPHAIATWNALCLADMGDKGFAFIALPQIPPRNLTKAMTGRWVHLAKVAFEKYFLRKVRKGKADPAYEKYILKAFGIARLKPEKRAA